MAWCIFWQQDNTQANAEPLSNATCCDYATFSLVAHVLIFGDIV